MRPPLEPGRLSLPAPWRVEVTDSTTSTNADVTARFLAGETEGLVLAAEHQTAGRGRLGRSWVTPARASLTASFLLTPDVPAERWPWLPLLTGLATLDAVRRTTGVAARLKWPNDLLVGEAKVAGILLERVDHGPRSAAVLGVGINVSQTQAELPVPGATSLALQGAAQPDRTALLAALVDRLVGRVGAWRAGADLVEEYAAACGTVGRRVRVDQPGGAITGRAEGIDGSGRLVVRTATGVAHVAAGDVLHVRPADPGGVP